MSLAVICARHHMVVAMEANTVLRAVHAWDTIITLLMGQRK